MNISIYFVRGKAPNMNKNSICMQYSNICVLTLLGQLQQKIVTNSPNWSGELMSQPYGYSRQGGCDICQGISMGLEPLIMQKGFISPFPSNNWGWDTTFSNKPKVSTSKKKNIRKTNKSNSDLWCCTPLPCQPLRMGGKILKSFIEPCSKVYLPSQSVTCPIFFLTKWWSYSVEIILSIGLRHLNLKVEIN